MSKKDMRKATFKDLIAKKLKKENEKTVTKDIYVTSMDATLTFKKPSDDLVIDTMDIVGDGKDTRAAMRGYKKLIYMCCEMLQDTELHAELEVVDPLDTVDVLFGLSDIMEIGTEIMELIDMSASVEEIKN
ncbi:MAG: hypothetical protein RR891_02765 [Clostridium sp.]